MQHNKTTIIAFLAIAAITLFALLGTPIKEDIPLEKVRIAVSTTPLSAPFYVAKEQGFFEESGVAATLVEKAGGGKCFSEMINGNVELATISNSVVMFNSFKHNNFAVLGSFVESDNDIKLLARTKENQRPTIRNLVGKKIGVVKGSASEYFLHSLLVTSGIEPDKVITVPLSVDKMPNALEQQTVDAISVWEPFAYQTHKHNQQAAQVDAKGLYNLSFVLAGKRDSSEAQIQLRTKVLQALNKATHFIASNPDQAQAILRSHLQLDQEFIDWIWQDYLFKLSLNNSLVTSLENQARWAVKSNLVTHEQIPSFQEFIDHAPLSKIDDISAF